MNSQMAEILELIAIYHPELDGVDLADDEVTGILKGIEVISSHVQRDVHLALIVAAQRWLESHK